MCSAAARLTDIPQTGSVAVTYAAGSSENFSRQPTEQKVYRCPSCSKACWLFSGFTIIPHTGSRMFAVCPVCVAGYSVDCSLTATARTPLHGIYATKWGFQLLEGQGSSRRSPFSWSIRPSGRVDFVMLGLGLLRPARLDIRENSNDLLVAEDTVVSRHSCFEVLVIQQGAKAVLG